MHCYKPLHFNVNGIKNRILFFGARWSLVQHMNLGRGNRWPWNNKQGFMILETHRVWTFFLLQQICSLIVTHPEITPAALWKNYERGIKTEPSEKPGVERRLVLFVLREMPAKLPSLGIELQRRRQKGERWCLCYLSTTPLVALCFQNNLISTSVTHFAI